MQIRKAERKKAKLRIGISSPSGAGKTYSALLLAYGLTGDWSKIGMIDTENGSGELYSHLGGYNILKLTDPFTPERFIEAIHAMEAIGMEAIIVDSVSHEWDGKGGCLQLNEKLAQAKYKGNTWSAWSETTPRHQQFLDAITMSPVHVITTARSKTEMIMGDDKKVKKVGMKDIQRDGFEYELTVMFNLDRDSHLAIASKDRTELFGDDPFLVTIETGKKLKTWGESGIDALVAVDPVEALRTEMRSYLAELGKEVAWIEEQVGKPIGEMTKSTVESVNRQLLENIEKNKKTPMEKFSEELDKEKQSV